MRLAAMGLFEQGREKERKLCESCDLRGFVRYKKHSKRPYV
jgi:hypothetical protein